MHIYFSGIGGAGIGPLAMVAKQAGYSVSGSDKQNSQYIEYLKKNGIENIHIGQSTEGIAAINKIQPIDWFVYSSALILENPHAPEFMYCKSQGIKISKRDELLNQILVDNDLKLIAIAGTHGKTTTTALSVWLLTQLHVPISYLLPAKTSFAEMGAFDSKSTYFVYEADEFDRNFLAYEPKISIITGVSWDHHEIFPTRDDYQSAFREFISQSKQTFIWDEDADYLELPDNTRQHVLSTGNELINSLTLLGKYNRLDTWLAVQAVHFMTNEPVSKLIASANAFPGLARRMEQLKPNLYSDYAHTPEKIRGCMSVASEIVAQTGQKLVVIYEPLTNRRQHFMRNDYRDSFSGADTLYWLPSYLAREDETQVVLTPQELIAGLIDTPNALAAEKNDALKKRIDEHLANGDLVVGIAGGGGNSLDDWLRSEFI